MTIFRSLVMDYCKDIKNEWNPSYFDSNIKFIINAEVKDDELYDSKNKSKSELFKDYGYRIILGVFHAVVKPNLNSITLLGKVKDYVCVSKLLRIIPAFFIACLIVLKICISMAVLLIVNLLATIIVRPIYIVIQRYGEVIQRYGEAMTGCFVKRNIESQEVGIDAYEGY